MTTVAVNVDVHVNLGSPFALGYSVFESHCFCRHDTFSFVRGTLASFERLLVRALYWVGTTRSKKSDVVLAVESPHCVFLQQTKN